MKLLKNNYKLIIGIIIGILLIGGISVYASTYLASQITYKNGKSVESALNELYEKNNFDLLWTNDNPTTNFAAQTLSLDLSNYNYVIVVTRTSTSEDYKNRASTIIPIGGTVYTGVGVSEDRAMRYAKASSSGIEFSDAHYGLQDNNTYAIPYKIYGVKSNWNLDIYE